MSTIRLLWLSLSNARTPEIPPLYSMGGWDGYFGLIVATHLFQSSIASFLVSYLCTSMFLNKFSRCCIAVPTRPNEKCGGIWEFLTSKSVSWSVTEDEQPDVVKPGSQGWCAEHPITVCLVLISGENDSSTIRTLGNIKVSEYSFTVGMAGG